MRLLLDNMENHSFFKWLCLATILYRFFFLAQKPYLGKRLVRRIHFLGDSPCDTLKTFTLVSLKKCFLIKTNSAVTWEVWCTGVKNVRATFLRWLSCCHGW